MIVVREVLQPLMRLDAGRIPFKQRRINHVYRTE